MNESENKQPQICSIKITLPVNSNEEALHIKQSIDEVFKRAELVKIDFTLTSFPTGLKPSFIPKES